MHQQKINDISTKILHQTLSKKNLSIKKKGLKVVISFYSQVFESLNLRYHL